MRQIDRDCCWRLRQYARARLRGGDTVSKPMASGLMVLHTQCTVYTFSTNFKYWQSVRTRRNGFPLCQLCHTDDDNRTGSVVTVRGFPSLSSTSAPSWLNRGVQAQFRDCLEVTRDDTPSKRKFTGYPWSRSPANQKRRDAGEMHGPSVTLKKHL
jgi:hypothetical protein